MPVAISPEPVIFHEIPLLKLDMALGLLRRAYKGDVDRSARWLVGLIQSGLVVRGSEAQSELMNCVTHSGWHNNQTKAMAALIVSEFRPEAIVYDAQGRPFSQTPIHNRWREVVVEAMAKDIRQQVAVGYGISIKYPVTDQRFTPLPDEAARRRAAEVPFPFQGNRGIATGDPDPFRTRVPRNYPPAGAGSSPAAAASGGLTLSSQPTYFGSQGLSGGLSAVGYSNLQAVVGSAYATFPSASSSVTSGTTTFDPLLGLLGSIRGY